MSELLALCKCRFQKEQRARELFLLGERPAQHGEDRAGCFICQRYVKVACRRYPQTPVVEHLESKASVAGVVPIHTKHRCRLGNCHARRDPFYFVDGVFVETFPQLGEQTVGEVYDGGRTSDAQTRADAGLAFVFTLAVRYLDVEDTVVSPTVTVSSKVNRSAMMRCSRMNTLAGCRLCWEVLSNERKKKELHLTRRPRVRCRLHF